MTLEEFAEKWKSEKFPDEAGQFLGAAIGILSGSGASRSDILELTGDIFDMASYMESKEGQENAAAFVAQIGLVPEDDLH